MIPTRITKTHIAEAIQRVLRDGVPPRRRGQLYCLVTNGEHLPPKYTISLAHQIATGEPLLPGQFHGGRESNEVLRGRGFAVVKCDCGGVHGDPNPIYTIDDAHQDLFIRRTDFTRLLTSIKSQRNLILQGAPGTGKTFIARRIA